MYISVAQIVHVKANNLKFVCWVNGHIQYTYEHVIEYMALYVSDKISQSKSHPGCL